MKKSQLEPLLLIHRTQSLHRYRRFFPRSRILSCFCSERWQRQGLRSKRYNRVGTPNVVVGTDAQS